MAQEASKSLVKPKDLAIYGPEKTSVVAPINSDIMEEYSSAGEAIKTVRMTINEGWRQILYTRDQIDYVVTTGKAHTEASIGMVKDEMEMLKDEENIPARVGFIGGGGLLGLLTAAIRRKGWVGKSIFTLVGTGLFTAILYPEDTVQFGTDLAEEGQRLSKIAINFVQGVQPEDVKEPKPSKSSSD